ncbi:MAG: OB-fold domain-containing protein [Pseudomonadota bacterium]
MSDQTWLPEPTEAARPFFDGAKEGKLRLQSCNQCHHWSFPPMTVCQNCGSSDISWKDASGEGTVYAHGRLARQYHPRHTNRLPIVLAQVDIAEGARLNTNIVGTDPNHIKAGDKVRVTFEQFDDGGVIPVFELAD